MSTCRNVVVAGVRCVGRGMKTWGECDMKLLGLQPELAIIIVVITIISIVFQDQSRIWTAASEQHKID